MRESKATVAPERAELDRQTTPAVPPESGESDTVLEDCREYLTLNTGGGMMMRLALIPAGEFMMGSPDGGECSSDEGPQHEVTVSQPFYMGVYYCSAT